MERWQRIGVAVAALWLASCMRGSQMPETVVRRVGGVTRTGRFVSPHSYEWFIRAELAFARRSYAEAARAYRLALAGPEEDPLILSRLAEALALLGDDQGAAIALAAAETLDPNAESLWLARGAIARQRGQNDRALTAYQRALQVAPDSQTARSRLVQALVRAGATERALTQLTKTTGQAGSPVPHALLRALLEADPEALQAHVTELETLPPGLSKPLEEAARRALGAGKPHLAARLARAAGIGNERASLWLEIWLRTGERARAENLLVMAPPEHLGGRLAIARAYLRLGQPARALDLAEAAWTAAPDHETQLVLAEAALQQGQIARALEHFSGALQQLPSSMAARRGVVRCVRAAAAPALAHEVASHQAEMVETRSFDPTP